MNRLYLLAAAVLAVALGPAAAQMPDSPTGRMAGALLELAGAEDDAAVESFLAERVAPSASLDSVTTALHALRKECRGGEIRGAEKSGPTAAKIELVAGGATCSVDYEIEASAPHRLTDIGLQITVGGTGGGTQACGGGCGDGGHDALVKAFAAAFNSGDFDTMQKFYAENATEAFLSRRTEEQDRELHEKLRCPPAPTSRRSSRRWTASWASSPTTTSSREWSWWVAPASRSSIAPTAWPTARPVDVGSITKLMTKVAVGLAACPRSHDRSPFSSQACNPRDRAGS